MRGTPVWCVRPPGRGPAAKPGAVPDGMDPERAVLTEPTACAVAAFDRLAESGPQQLYGRQVLVLGCGAVGLLAVRCAVAQGAQVVAVDPLDRRRSIAQTLGATTAETAPADASFEVAVDAVGIAATWAQAVASVRNGGTVMMLGLGAPRGDLEMASLVRRSIHLIGHFAYTRDAFERALAFLAEDDFDLSWIDRVPLEEGTTALRGLIEHPEQLVKVTFTR